MTSLEPGCVIDRGESADVARTSGPSPPPARNGLVALDAVAAALLVVDGDGVILRVNSACERLIGAPAAMLEGTQLDRWAGAALGTPDGTVASPRSLERSVARLVRANGDGMPVEIQISALEPDGPYLLTVGDASLSARLDAALQERKDLTEQLRRSQKISALGRLAGGVAHDFNNLLQVISGHAEALSGPLDAEARHRLQHHVQATTDRAAALTRQLLAFGRRQLLVPRVLDLNATVRTLERMLTRIIGEDVRLESALAPDLAAVEADPGQVEQVVLNLAINARDAMLDGGTLAISTANFVPTEPWTHPALPVRIPAGAWVLLSVRDTGCGMDADTTLQAFEPFFTTKDPVKGSGLGLSMVYGIVKQSGGYTWIESEPGAGTSVHVLLPAVSGSPGEAGARPPSPEAVVAIPQGVRILLVEDDPNVRALFARFLESAGYTVFEAADGRDALDIAEAERTDFDLVITDVVMPNMSGPALATALRTRRPEVKVLFVSGYADTLEAGTAHGPRTLLLHKPVSRTLLLDQVAALLRSDEA